MGAVGRTLIIVIVVVLGLGAALYFLGPQTASRNQTLEIERPAETVLARLASTPANTTIIEGVTTTEAATLDGDTVTAPVAYADGAAGRVTYRVTADGEGANVNVKLEQNLGPNPLARIDAFTGGDVAPLIASAATAVETDLNALPNATFTGLAYDVVQIEARPFFFIENCSSTEPDSVTSILTQAASAIPPLMRANNLTQAGSLTAVEPRVVEDRYCYQIGYPYSGRAPRGDLLTGQAGQTPGGTMLHVHYTGTETDVIAQVYDKVDALLGAAHLDNPGTREDDWTTFEVYNDDPTQAGGSRNREIYYVSQGDISAVTRLLPETEPAAAAPAAEAPATTTTPPATTTPAPTP